MSSNKFPFQYKESDLLAKEDFNSESQAYNFSAFVKAVAIELGFPSFDASLISLAVSEICINSIKYAHGAIATLALTKNNKGLSIYIEDQGDGIDDINLAMRPSHSTQSSLGLGLGLGAAKRSTDEMHIDTSSNGTKILLTSYLPVSSDLIDTGSVSFPKVSQHYNCNDFVIKHFHGDSIFIGLYNCNEDEQKVSTALDLLLPIINEGYELPLVEVLERCHQQLISQEFTKGFDMGLLKITPSIVESLCYGDTYIDSTLQSKPVALNDNFQLSESFNRSVNLHRYSPSSNYCFSMRSNGVIDTDLTDKQLQNLSATKHAEQLFDRFASAEEDATIIVVKING
ncbi:MAG: hypothetical protein GY787_27810 [Alteromonadales bacterium]|nr:hypothetical protein [Alteromonadales bacterium]